MTTRTHSSLLSDKRRAEHEEAWEWGDGDDFYFKSEDCNSCRQILIFNTHVSLQLDMTSMERGQSENHASELLPKSGLKNIKSTKLLNVV